MSQHLARPLEWYDARRQQVVFPCVCGYTTDPVTPDGPNVPQMVAQMKAHQQEHSPGF